jgi:DNA-binding SARP family transcriptional activator
MHGQIKLGATKVRGLLGYLSYRANEVVHVDRIAEALWDGEPPPGAEKTLQTYVSRLRKVLKDASCPASVEREHHAYRLAVDKSTVDFYEFKSIVRSGHRAFGNGDLQEAARLFQSALAIWNGPPLADIDTPGARRLRETLTTQDLIPTHCALFDAKLTLGDHEFVLARLPDLLTDHPLNEALACYWVRALVAGGRAGEVPAFYREFTQRYRAELDAPPSAELRRLVTAATTTTSAPARDHRRPDLPRATPYFTGREDLLARLDQLLVDGDGAVDVVALDGPPGIGKTTLAKHWARRRQDAFPDGVLYYDLLGYANAPLVGASTAIINFLDQLGVGPSRVPDDAAERAVLMRETLSRRKMLIIIDNVRDSSHVRPLLASTAGCPVLITSRQQLSGIAYRDGVQNLSVAALPAQDAAALLEKRIGERAAADPAATAKLVRLCHGLPLALRIASEHIALRTTAPIDELSEELRDARRLLDAGAHGDDDTMTLRSAFSWSYRALEPAEQQLLRRLGMHPGARFSVRAVTALAGRDTEVERLLDALIGAHLVAQERAGRYHIHDLLHEYATATAAADEPAESRDRAHRRMFDWYVDSARAARALLAGDDHDVPELPTVEPVERVEPMAFGNTDDALHWLVTERDNLVACTYRAAELGYHEHVWRFSGCLDILNRYEDPRSLLAIHELGRQSAAIAGRPDAAGGCLNNKGTTYARLNENAAAGRCFEMAYEAFKEAGDQRGLAVVTHNIGSVFILIGQPAEAITWLDEALGMNVRLADEWKIANTHRKLGDAYTALNRLTDAQSHYRQSLYSSQAAKDPASEAASLARLCRLNVALDEIETAIAYGEAALDVFNRIHLDKDGTAGVLCALSAAHLRAGNHRKAVTAAKEAARTYRETQNVSSEIDALILLGRAFSASGEPAEASLAWTEATTLVTSSSDTRLTVLRALLAQSTEPPLPTPRATPAAPAYPTPLETDASKGVC